MNKNKISAGQCKIEKLQHAEQCGDWHDKPLRWAVVGPDSEVQKFSLKKDAELYRRLRRSSACQHEAISAYVLA